MLGRASHTGKDGVEVHLEIVGNVARHHGPLEKVYIVQPIRNPGCVMQILERAVAIGFPVWLDHMNGSPSRSKMHARPLKLKVMSGIAAMKRDPTSGLGQHVFDQSAWKADPAIIALNGACARQDLNPTLRRVSKSDFLKRCEGRLVDFCDIHIRERPIDPAR